jgi:hypothetical protein
MNGSSPFLIFKSIRFEEVFFAAKILDVAVVCLCDARSQANTRNGPHSAATPQVLDCVTVIKIQDCVLLSEV